MRTLRAYNEERKAVWRGALRPDEVALFHVNALTGRDCKPNGEKHQARTLVTCMAFESVEEAERHAEAVVRNLPTVACTIYGREAADPLRTVVNTDFADGFATTPSIRKLVAWGLALDAVSVGLVWYDAANEWCAIWPTVFASKFLMLGTVLLGTGVVQFFNYRQFWKGGRTASVLLRPSKEPEAALVP